MYLCIYVLKFTISDSAGLIGAANVFAPLVFNLRRNTLSPAATYRILKSGPPKHTLAVWLFAGGAGMIAFTRPS